MTQCFKIFTKPYFGTNLGTFAQIGTKINSIKPKIRKKLMSYSWEKYQTVGWTDNSDFIRTSVGRGPIIKATKSQFLPLISYWDTANFRVLLPGEAQAFMTSFTTIFFNELLNLMNLYQFAKTQAFYHFALEIFDLKATQSDWPKAFRPYLRNQNFQ